MKKRARWPQRGDHMKVVRGPFKGAEGLVESAVQASKFVMVTVMQRNGNVIRLPRSHWKFAAYEG